MAERIVRLSKDASRQTGVRADCFCGACGAGIGRFDRTCRSCGEAVELDRWSKDRAHARL